MVASVAIIGGGFSGAILAYHLATTTVQPLLISIVEPRETLGAGVAYGDARDSETLNVPAVRMIVDRDDPAGFPFWLRARGEGDGDTYALRRQFAAFVASRVAGAFAHRSARLEHHRSAAAEIASEGGQFVVRLSDDRVLRPDAVVLCTGHERPRLPGSLAHLAQNPATIVDPWACDALDAIDRNARVLVVGTGLTAADVVVWLRRHQHQGRIVAVSRRGLIPRRSGVYPASRGDFVVPARAGVVALLRAAKHEVRAAAAAGIPWQAVLSALREQNGAIWQAWPDEERARFLRHLRPYWDVHRFQMAPHVANVLVSAIATGALNTVAGRILHALPRGNAIAVEIAQRGKPHRICEEFDAIVNCTGGGGASGAGLIGRLVTDGLAQPDRFGLGLRVDGDGRIANRTGARPSLFALGPLTRGSLGEVSGASEIADQAARLATLLVDEISRARPPAARTRLFSGVLAG